MGFARLCSARRAARTAVSGLALALPVFLVAGSVPASAEPRAAANTGVDAFVPGPAKKAGAGSPPPKTAPARPSGEARDLPERRTDRSRTFAEPDGSFRTDVFQAPVHFQDAAGTWQPIDNTLVAGRRPGVAFENKADRFAATLPADLATGPVSLGIDGRSVGFALQGANGAPSAKGSSATYAEALPGVAATYRVTGSGIKEELALAGPTSPTTFRFAVSPSPGLTPRQSASGGIDFVDAGGRVAMGFAAPFMYEAANQANSSKAVGLRVAQDSPLVIELAADPGWLAAPGRSWPVVVDPWLTIPEAATDTYVGNGVDAANNHGTDHALNVGYDGTVVNRGLVRFPVEEAIPEAHRVREAFMWLDMGTQPYGSSTMSIAAHALTQPYEEYQASWNNRATSTAWTSAGGDFNTGAEWTNTAVGGGSLGWKDWNLTNAVQSWADSPGVTNYGVALKSTNETSANQALFRSWEYGRDVDASAQPYMAIHWDAILGIDDQYSYETRALTDRRSASVNVASGNLVVSESDLAIRGTGLDLNVERQYNSRRNQEGGDLDLGQRWSMSPQTDYRGVIQRNGDFVMWGGREQYGRFAKKSDGSFTDAPGYDATLVQLGNGHYVMTLHKSNTKMEFESWGGLIKITDRNDNVIEMSWAQHGGNWFIDGITDTQNRSTTFTRNATTAKITAMTDPTGRVSGYGYTANNLTTFTDARNKTTTYAYDANGYLTRITDPMSNATKFAYDADGRVTTMTQVSDNVTDTGPTTSFSYNYTTRTSTVTDANNKVTTYTFDRQGRVTKVTDALGHARDRRYTSNSSVEKFNGSATSAVYDLGHDTNDNLTSIASPASASGQTRATTSFTYPTFSGGSPLSYLANSRTDAQGNCGAFGYDAKGNMTTSYDGLTPSGSPPSCATGTNTKKNTQTYNANGTLQSSSNPEANKNDALRMTCGGTTVRASTCYGYDTSGNLSSVSHPSGSGLGNESITVDSLSRVTSVTDGKGQKACRLYDALDHLTRLDYNVSGSCPAPTATCPSTTCNTYAYDDVGNLTSRVDNTGTTAFDYDRLNRTTKKTLPGGVAACSGQGGMTYAYDPVGNQTSACDDDGTITYRYNDDNTAKDLAEPGGSCSTTPATKCTTFGYNDPVTSAFQDGRRTTTTYPTSPAVVMTSTYDPAGNTKKIEAKAGSSVLTSYSYTYTQSTADRDLRQRMTENVSGVSTDYAYDPSNRLTGANASVGDDFTYAYDDNANRTNQVKNTTTTTFGYNLASNQLTSVTGQAAAPTFDANGNQTKTQTNMVPAYNAKDQTSSFTPSGASAINLTYADADSTEMTAAGPAGLASGLRGVSRDARSGGTYHYPRDPEGKLVARRSSSGSQYYYLFDGLGSVVGLATTSGALANGYRYTYDPYGNQTSAAPALGNPWRYAGGLAMDDITTGTSLTKFGTRYYDATLGRWTQQDSVAGSIDDPSSMNRYTYVGCDPVNFTDPDGRLKRRQACSAGAASIGAIGLGLGLAVALTGPAGLAGFAAVGLFGATSLGSGQLCNFLAKD